MTIPVFSVNPPVFDTPRPKDVGVLAIETYFPRRCISEADLEVFDGVPKGKYTIGLGQEYMACCDDREDINSFALNVVSGLLEKYNIDPKKIGRIEVGTETIIDKSKSVKTTLMDLFAASGNFDIEGIDSKNACYGSTAALFNAINWVESTSWDGRLAIVVAADIAVYAEGPARPAGGAGAVAMLIGPNAAIVFEPIHGTYMANTYDFYKPKLDSEYPEVDGPVSVVTYIAALDAAYTRYKEKSAKASKLAARSSQQINGTGDGLVISAQNAPFSLDDIDYAIFHSPYGKQTVKAHARLLYNDFLADPSDPRWTSGEKPAVPAPQTVLQIPRAASLTDKTLEKTFVAAAQTRFARQVDASMACSRRLGNTYTASLYACLASLVSRVPPADLRGRRISFFAFGSGCAASFFVARVKGDTSEMRNKMNLLFRLASMTVVSCQEYVDALALREKSHIAAAYTPSGPLEHIWPGAYYLESVDAKYRRKYARAPLA